MKHAIECETHLMKTILKMKHSDLTAMQVYAGKPWTTLSSDVYVMHETYAERCLKSIANTFQEKNIYGSTCRPPALLGNRAWEVHGPCISGFCVLTLLSISFEIILA